MTLPDFANIGQIVQAIVVTISLIFVWLELRQSNALARASNAQRLQELASPFNLELIKDAQVTKFWLATPTQVDEFNESDRYRHHSLVMWWLMLHEMIHYQYKNKLLDRDIYSAWEVDLKSFAAQKLDERTWQICKKSLEGEFAAHVEKFRVQ